MALHSVHVIAPKGKLVKNRDLVLKSIHLHVYSKNLHIGDIAVHGIWSYMLGIVVMITSLVWRPYLMLHIVINCSSSCGTCKRIGGIWLEVFSTQE